MAHPDRCSLAHCEADCELSRSARWTVRFLVIFAYERKEDQTKIPRECPLHHVLGSSRMVHPDHCSLAHSEVDILKRG